MTESAKLTKEDIRNMNLKEFSSLSKAVNTSLTGMVMSITVLALQDPQYSREEIENFRNLISVYVDFLEEEYIDSNF